MSASRPVVVVGDLMVDVVVRITGAHHPRSDTRAQISMHPGGAATNQAVALALSGAAVTLVASIGDDSPGRSASVELDRLGVACHLHRGRGATGTVVAIIEADGDRSMLTDRGANLELHPTWLSALEWPTHGHLHLSGYTLLDEATRPAGLTALTLARQQHLSVSADTAATGLLAELGPERYLELVGPLDLLFANAEEAAVLTGGLEPHDAAVALRAHAQEVIITMGASGALVAVGDQLLRAAAHQVNVADTTGAGDAHTGTYLAARLRDLDPLAALTEASAAAAQAVGVTGANRPPSSSR